MLPDLLYEPFTVLLYTILERGTALRHIAAQGEAQHNARDIKPNGVFFFLSPLGGGGAGWTF